MDKGDAGQEPTGKNTLRSQGIAIISLVVIGLGIGWLAGLSVSPVISVVITSVVGVAAAVVTALSGVKEEPEKPDARSHQQLPKLAVWPLAVLIAGMLAGSALGIRARNYNIFGPTPATVLAQEVGKWTAYGLDRQVVAHRLFEAKYGYRGWLGQDVTLEVSRWVTDTTQLESAEVARRLFESTYPLESTGTTAANIVTTASGSDVISFTTLKSAEAKQQSRELCEVARNNPGSTLRAYINDVVTIGQVISLTATISDDQILKEAMVLLCIDG